MVPQDIGSEDERVPKDAYLDVSLLRQGGRQVHSCQIPIGVMDFSKNDKKKLDSIDSWLVEPEVPSPFVKSLVTK